MASDNTKKIAVVLTGENKTQQAFRGAGQSLDGFKSKLQSMSATFTKMAAVGTAAFAGIAYGTKQVVTAAAESQRASVTFDALNKSIGSVSSDSLEKLRASTRGMVADTDLMLAGNKFMAMGLATTQDEMSKLAQISTKLGTAMGNGATESMENFALMMANQSILRLDSFGISSGKVRERIEELMTSTEGMTREMAFNAAVMEQAEATMKKLGEPALTMADRMDIMKAKTENLKTSLGEALIPAIERLVNAVTPIIEKFTLWAQENPKTLMTIVGVAAGLSALVAVIGTIGLVLPSVIFGVQALGGAMMFLATNPIGLLIVAIVGLTVLIVKNWDKIKQVTSTLIDNIVGGFEVARDGIYNAWQSIKDGIGGAIEGIKQLVADLKQSIMDFVYEHPVWASVITGAILGAVLPAFLTLATTITTTVLSAFLSFGTMIVTQTIPAIGSFITTLVTQGIPAVLKFAASMITSGVTAIASFVTSLVAGAIAGLASFATMIMTTVIPAIISFATAVLLPLLPFILVGAAVAGLAALIIMNWDKIKNWTVSTFTAIGTTIAGVWEKIKAGALLVAQSISGAFKQYINGIAGMFEGMVNGVITALNFLIKGMNKIQVKIPDWVPKIGGKSFGVNINEIAKVEIPRLAEGGIVTKSTLANIGEAGAEAVIPLDKLKNFGVGGGGSVSINIDTMVGDDDFAVKMGDRIIESLKFNSRFVS